MTSKSVNRYSLHIRTVIDSKFAALFKTDFIFYISARKCSIWRP